MPALPQGAPLTGPTPPSLCPRPNGPASGLNGCDGKYAAKCSRTATGPTPGPPPPCGIAKVLCKFKCETSAPNLPGFAKPTNAFRFAPST